MQPKIMELSDVEPGYVFKFFKFQTERVINPFMLRLTDCYAELGEGFDAVEKLDGRVINLSEETVKVYGKFSALFQIVK